MKPKLLLRIAAILMLLHNVGHTMGFSGGKQSPDPVKQEVIKQMTGHSFPFMGAVHSLGDYYEGFGYAATLALLLIAAILWVVSGYTEQTEPLVKRILIVLSVILLAWGVNELIFF